MKVLIIGGMGIIGGAITEVAISNGLDVFVLSRRKPFEKWKEISAHYVQGDWKDDSFAKSLVSEYFDVIVDTQIFNERQLIRSLNIVNGHCTQFIYISTDSVYVHPSVNLTEDEDINIKNVKWKYGFDKRQAELYLLANSSKYNFYWTVIRPTITFGDTRIPVGFSSKRNTFTLIERIVNHKPIIRFDDPETTHSLCHVLIFGNAVVRLFLNDNAANQFYHISDDKSYTYDEIFSVIEQIVGSKGNYIYMPTDILKKYNKDIFEEMIYDKNPTFILKNDKIRAICQNMDFCVDMVNVLKSTISYLERHKEKYGEDKDYNILTDIILLKHRGKIKNLKERQVAENYIASLSYEYTKILRKKELTIRKQNVINKIKERLWPIKQMIIKG